MFALHEFFIKGSRSSGSHVLIHLSEPQPGDTHGSYLFSVAEIQSKKPALVQAVQQLLDEADKMYSSSTLDHREAFEHMVRMINGTKLPVHRIGSVNWFFGAMNDGLLLFTATGKVRAELFYQKGSSLGSLTIHKPTPPAADTIFDEVSEGRMKTTDTLFVSSPNTGGHISSDILARMLLTQGAEKASSIIEQKLNTARTGEPYGGLFLEASDEPVIVPPVDPVEAPLPVAVTPENVDQTQAAVKAKAKGLMSRLKRQKKVEKAPPPPPKHASERAKSKPKKRVETNFRPRQMKREEPLHSLILIMLGRAIFIVLSNIFLLLKSAAVGVWRGSIMVLLLITNKGNQRNTIKEQVAMSMNEHRHAVRKAPLLSKILFALTVVSAIVFVGSLIHLRIKDNARVRETARSNEIQAIEDKLLAAEKSLLYSDKDRARSLIAEAEHDVAGFAIIDPEDVTKKASFEQSLAELELTLRDVRIVPSTLIADLSQANPNAAPTKLFLLGDELFAFGGEEDVIYRISLLTGNVVPNPHSAFPTLLGAALGGTDEEPQLSFLTEQSNLATFDLAAGALQSLELEKSQSSAFAAMAMYNNRLYTLDAGRGQILRHDRTQTGFSRGDIWLTAPEPSLLDGVDMAIDGNVYALTKAGGVFKYSRGNQQAFAVKGLEPGLASPTSLWTSTDSRYLYITEPSEQRVVILTKQGITVGQFISDSWQMPISALSYNNNTIVLDGGKIYSFEF